MRAPSRRRMSDSSTSSVCTMWSDAMISCLRARLMILVAQTRGIQYFDIGLLPSIISKIFFSLSNMRPASTRCCQVGNRRFTRNEMRISVITYASTAYRIMFLRIRRPVSFCAVWFDRLKYTKLQLVGEVLSVFTLDFLRKSHDSTAPKRDAIVSTSLLSR